MAHSSDEGRQHFRRSKMNIQLQYNRKQQQLKHTVLAYNHGVDVCMVCASSRKQNKKMQVSDKKHQIVSYVECDEYQYIWLCESEKWDPAIITNKNMPSKLPWIQRWGSG